MKEIGIIYKYFQTKFLYMHLNYKETDKTKFTKYLVIF